MFIEYCNQIKNTTERNPEQTAAAACVVGFVLGVSCVCVFV